MIDASTLPELLIQAAVIAFAALVHGAIGIGFPMIATPLLALFSDVRSAILLLVLPTMAINVANILNGGRWTRSIAAYWPLAAYGVIGSYAGTRMLVGLSPEPFRPLLAAMLILYLNAERFGIGLAWVHRRPQLAFACFGLAGGLLAGTVNVMLPALIIYALEVKMPKAVTIQVFNFCFLVGKLTQGAVLVQADLYTVGLLKASLVMVGWALAVMFIGMRIRERIPTDAYRRWLRRLLALLAAFLVVQSF